MNNPSEQRRTGKPGCLLAFLIGLLVVAFIQAGFWVLAGSPPNPMEDWGRYLFQAALIAVPFGFLVLNGVSAKTPWITAVLLTAVVWGFVLAATFQRPWRANDMGLALLTLLSPVITTAGAFAADRLARRLWEPASDP